MVLTRLSLQKASNTKGLTSLTRQVCEDDVRCRIDKARKAFWRLASIVCGMRSVSVKVRVYRACVPSVVLYGSETCTNFQCSGKLEQLLMMCLRKISHVGIWEQEHMHIKDTEVRAWLGVATICMT